MRNSVMPFRFHFLILMVLAAPFIIATVTYSVCRKLGQIGARRSETPPTVKPPRQTYFYPTREIDGNGLDF
jgi:hypothetical protein